MSSGASGLVKFAKLLNYLTDVRSIDDIAAHMQVDTSTAYAYMRDLIEFGFAVELPRTFKRRDSMGRMKSKSGYRIRV